MVESADKMHPHLCLMNDGITPLMEAVNNGDLQRFRLLLENGANVHSTITFTGDNALIIAAHKGSIKFVKELLLRGAQADVKNKSGNTPLWLAAHGGHLSVVKLLHKYNADIDSLNNKNVSGLMAAYMRGHVKTVKWMAKHVNLFPNDLEMIRYNSSICDIDILEKCRKCMNIIQTAKQAHLKKRAATTSFRLKDVETDKNYTRFIMNDEKIKNKRQRISGNSNENGTKLQMGLPAVSYTEDTPGYRKKSKIYSLSSSVVSSSSKTNCSEKTDDLRRQGGVSIEKKKSNEAMSTTQTSQTNIQPTQETIQSNKSGLHLNEPDVSQVYNEDFLTSTNLNPAHRLKWMAILKYLFDCHPPEWGPIPPMDSFAMFNNKREQQSQASDVNFVKTEEASTLESQDWSGSTKSMSQADAKPLKKFEMFDPDCYFKVEDRKPPHNAGFFNGQLNEDVPQYQKPPTQHDFKYVKTEFTAEGFNQANTQNNTNLTEQHQQTTNNNESVISTFNATTSGTLNSPRRKDWIDALKTVSKMYWERENMFPTSTIHNYHSVYYLNTDNLPLHIHTGNAQHFFSANQPGLSLNIYNQMNLASYLPQPIITTIQTNIPVTDEPPEGTGNGNH